MMTAGVANVSSANTERSEQPQLDGSAPASQKPVTQTELKVLCRYQSVQFYSATGSWNPLRKKSKF